MAMNREDKSGCHKRLLLKRLRRVAELVGPFPNKGLKYPKRVDKPPFQTNYQDKEV